jgi:hypothetical protein
MAITTKGMTTLKTMATRTPITKIQPFSQRKRRFSLMLSKAKPKNQFEQMALTWMLRLLCASNGGQAFKGMPATSLVGTSLCPIETTGT